MLELLRYPFDAPVILRKQNALKRALLARQPDTKLRVAILGGVTTSNLKPLLELFLLHSRIEPSFYESEYNRYYEDVLVDSSALVKFAPQVAVIYVTSRNVSSIPALLDSAETVERSIAQEVERYGAMWRRLVNELGCLVVQNNFEPLAQRSSDHLSATLPGGAQNYLNQLNVALSKAARQTKGVLIHDAAHLSATLGLDRWHSPDSWYSYKHATSLEGTVASAHSIARTIAVGLGQTRKCLVLDLDNTLWGGVIGDDGLAKIKLGRESALGEAFVEFQHYCLSLKQRGVLLAVASKNELANAREGFSHPDSVLKLEDFSAFVANWERKDQNLVAIAKSLNLGLDSLVFVDDNPAERELVREQLPDVAVPEVGSNVAEFAGIVERQRYFDRSALSAEDLSRSAYYADNRAREDAEATFASYDEYLASLQMKAEIAAFSEKYLDRITQLANKTNQFNLTTRRYTVPEMSALMASPRFATLYGRLADRFGDNGLVSLVVAEQKGSELHIDLWLMSCRVLKRDFELAMFDELVAAAIGRGITRIVGHYLRTPKNDMVAEHYQNLGFELTSRADDDSRSEWRYDLPSTYTPKNKAIKEIIRG